LEAAEEKEAVIEVEKGADKAHSEPTRPSQSRTINKVEENFNYVVYDDSKESPPPTIKTEEKPK
jgi:hypothetical protein